jgi:hypothetical protein
MFRRSLTVLVLLSAMPRTAAADVANSADLRAAIEAAQPGATIRLAPGAYALSAPIATRAAGTMAQPILITAGAASTVRLDVSAPEGLVVAHPYWILEHVWINGIGGSGAGIHLKPGGDHFVVRACRVTNFGTGILSDRTADTEVSDGAAQANEFYNDTLAAGGTPMRIVGGQRWAIAGNYFHDYAGAGMHPGLSLEGGAADAVVEQNLFACSKDRPPAGMAVGVYVGGPGTMPGLCAATNQGASSCACETSAGLVRNNIVAHCAGAGVAANHVCGTKVHGNTVYDTTPGLDVQAPGTMGALDAKFNVLSGAAMGLPPTDNVANLAAPMFKMVYLDPDGLDYFQGANDKAVNDLGAGALGKTDPDLPSDYVGLMRKPTLDWGALELPTTIHTWPWAGAAAIGTGPVPPLPPPVDAGVLADAAGPLADADQPADAEGPVDAAAGSVEDAGVPPVDASPGSGGNVGGSSGAAATPEAVSRSGGCSIAFTDYGGGAYASFALLAFALPLLRRRAR